MIGGRVLEAAVTSAANVGWTLLQFVSGKFPAASVKPKWAPAPLLKSWEKSSPVLGWPRTTDSLCPTCVKETRAQILAGDIDLERLRHQTIGEIKATIHERHGRVEIEKTCPHHGTFTDTLAISP